MCVVVASISLPASPRRLLSLRGGTLRELCRQHEFEMAPGLHPRTGQGRMGLVCTIGWPIAFTDGRDQERAIADLPRLGRREEKRLEAVYH